MSLDVQIRQDGRRSQVAVTDLVAMLEPKADSTFSNLDNRLFPSITRNIGIADENNLRRVARSVAGSEYEGEELFKRISEFAGLRPTVLDFAGRDPATTGTTAEVVESMLGRALILCRLATGGAVRLRSEAGIDTEDLRWWSDEVGADHGYWDPADPPERLSDLWNEVGEGIDDVLSVDLSRSESPYEMLIFASGGIRAISSLGRVAIWSLSA